MKITASSECQAKDITPGQSCLYSSSLFIRLDDRFYPIPNPNKKLNFFFNTLVVRLFLLWMLKMDR